ncbi:manganese efflux pump [Thermogutta sp.]|uniref:manganese efflux pump n=1 Tax=Thermogutta sp. TaxID=1962930 RepID=UPI0034509B60
MWLAAVIIGLVAGILSLIGIRAGNRLGRHFSQWAEIAGGCVLLLVGLRILLTHLMFL